jgi:hypothetical protein
MTQTPLYMTRSQTHRFRRNRFAAWLAFWASAADVGFFALFLYAGAGFGFWVWVMTTAALVGFAISYAAFTLASSIQAEARNASADRVAGRASGVGPFPSQRHPIVVELPVDRLRRAAPNGCRQINAEEIEQ